MSVNFYNLLVNIDKTSNKSSLKKNKLKLIQILEESIKKKGPRNKETLPQIEEFCQDNLIPIQAAVSEDHSLTPATDDYRTEEIKSISVANQNSWWSNTFFKALDYWFSYSLNIKNTDKTIVANDLGFEDIYLKAFKQLQDYKEVVDFYTNNPNLTEYQELARDVLEHCEKQLVQKTLQELTDEQKYKIAGEALKNIYLLHKIGIPEEDLRSVYKLLRSKDKFAELAKTVYSENKLNNDIKVRCLVEIADHADLHKLYRKRTFQNLKKRIDTTIASVNIDPQIQKFLLKHATYQKLDINTESRYQDSQDLYRKPNEKDRPEAYSGEILAGKSPVAHFFNPLTGDDNKLRLWGQEFLGLYHSDQAGVINTWDHGHTDPIGGIKAFMNNIQKAQCLYLDGAEKCSRRHSAFLIDKKKNIWLRHTSESYELGVFRKIKQGNSERLVELPTFNNERLKLEKGDVFFIGHLELELTNKDEITVRKLNKAHATEYLQSLEGQETSNLDLNQIYEQGAPVYKLKANSKGSFDKPKQLATTTISEDLAKEKYKIFQAFANIVGIDGFLNLSTIFYQTGSKERTNINK